MIFKKLDNIFILLLASQLFLILTSIFLITNQMQIFSVYISNEIKIAVMVITLSTVILLRFYYNSSISKIKNLKKETEKEQKFYDLNLNRMSLTEAINLLNLIIFLISGEYTFVLISIILFILFIVYRPTQKSFLHEMNKSL